MEKVEHNNPSFANCYTINYSEINLEELYLNDGDVIVSEDGYYDYICFIYGEENGRVQMIDIHGEQSDYLSRGSMKHLGDRDFEIKIYTDRDL